MYLMLGCVVALGKPGPKVVGFLAKLAHAVCIYLLSATSCVVAFTAVIVPKTNGISEEWKTPALGKVCVLGKEALKKYL